MASRNGSIMSTAAAASWEGVASGSARRRDTLWSVRMVAAAADRQLSLTSSSARSVITHMGSRWGATWAQRRPCRSAWCVRGCRHKQSRGAH